MARILVIDDSAFMRKLSRDQLEEAGFEAEEYLPGSVLQLVEKLRESRPDLVLSDFNMPYVDGLEVARNVRRVDPAIPLIILTANRYAAREARLQTMGVRMILHKPVSGEALVDAVKQVLAGS